jgi:hypothetical protein
MGQVYRLMIFGLLAVLLAGCTPGQRGTLKVSGDYTLQTIVSERE